MLSVVWLLQRRAHIRMETGYADLGPSLPHSNLVWPADFRQAFTPLWPQQPSVHTQLEQLVSSLRELGWTKRGLPSKEQGISLLSLLLLLPEEQKRDGQPLSHTSASFSKLLQHWPNDFQEI